MVNISIKLAITLIGLIIASGCTLTAVQYQTDFNVVNSLKDNEIQNLSVGDFESVDKSVENLSIRGSSMVTSFDGSYAGYLKNALIEQLQQSFLFHEEANIVISGTLLANDIDASGFSIGTADIVAKFIVTKENHEIYNKDHSIQHQWDSSFVGSIAIPNAQNNYPIAVQKLIAVFLTDPEFIKVVHK
jgi:hypothetical protein